MATRNSSSNTKNFTLFSNSGYSSYEHQFSVLSYTYGNDGSFLSLAPILKEKQGKSPSSYKKGESVYNYDNKLMCVITPEHAVTLLQGLSILESEDSEFTKIHVESKLGENSRAITIVKPNSIKLGGQTFDNFILKITVTKKDETRTLYHIFNSTKLSLIRADKTEEEIEVSYDMEIFKEFLKSVIDNSLSMHWHAARRAVGFNGGKDSTSSKKDNDQSNLEEEDLDDDQKKSVKEAEGNFDDEFAE